MVGDGEGGARGRCDGRVWAGAEEWDGKLSFFLGGLL